MIIQRLSRETPEAYFSYNRSEKSPHDPLVFSHTQAINRSNNVFCRTAAAEIKSQKTGLNVYKYSGEVYQTDVDCLSSILANPGRQNGES